METKILIQLETWYLSMNKVGAYEDLDKVRALSYKAISKAAKYENDSVFVKQWDTSIYIFERC